MHLLQQHSFNIDCSSQAFGKEVQSQLSGLLEKDFYPKLELLLDQYTNVKHTWSIDLLELELPKISKRNWKNELVNYSLSQIEDYLKNKVPSFENNNNQVIENNHFISNEAYLSFLFFHFLKTGVLLDNSISKNLDTILAEIKIDDDFLEKLFENFEKEMIYLERWIFTMPTFFKEKVMDSIFDFQKIPFSVLNDIVLKNTSNALEIKLLKEKLAKEKALTSQWLELLNWINYSLKKLSAKQLIFEKFVQLSKLHWDISLEEIKLFFKIMNNDSKTEFVFDQMQSFLKKFSNDKVSDSLDTTFYATEKPLSLTKSNSTDTNHIQFISNAGLVILHPFLSSLFEQLNLCKNTLWKTKMSQHKAVLLSQFLITGQDKIDENELVLNKILCGLPIESVVNTHLKITKKEKEKCKSLLEAVLEHWKAMRKSSIEALQETFLQREGKLEIKRDGFELWVEEKGYDILLEQLPWGIGMVKTPWMEEYLTCNWN
jgi:hypothetical protein